MIWLILGVALWVFPHEFKRLAPAARAQMGASGRSMVAGLIFLGILLMVVGYRAADGAVFWGRSAPLVGINNLLMLCSIYLFAASGMKTAIARKMRHPMLTGMVLWALAHLLVNGDVPSFVLFGGLGIWALVEMRLINKAVPNWTPPKGKGPKMEIFAVLGTLIVYGAIAGVHYALGYAAFG
jgi:uncharacterized membrane protein